MRGTYPNETSRLIEISFCAFHREFHRSAAARPSQNPLTTRPTAISLFFPTATDAPAPPLDSSQPSSPPPYAPFSVITHLRSPLFLDEPRRCTQYFPPQHVFRTPDVVASCSNSAEEFWLRRKAQCWARRICPQISSESQAGES